MNTHVSLVIRSNQNRLCLRMADLSCSNSMWAYWEVLISELNKFFELTLLCCAHGAEGSCRTVDILHGEREMGGRLVTAR